MFHCSFTTIFVVLKNKKVFYERKLLWLYVRHVRDPGMVRANVPRAKAQEMPMLMENPPRINVKFVKVVVGRLVTLVVVLVRNDD